MTMTRNMAIATLAAVVLSGTAFGLDRVNTSQKGSLLVFPKVQVRYNNSGHLAKDTLIQISNDEPQAVNVQLYFIGEHCEKLDNLFELTQNEPAFWAASSGLPKGVSPAGALGFTPDELGNMTATGYVVAWAVDANNDPIVWNDLTGDATIINYTRKTAAQYKAYSFRALSGVQGEVIGTPGSGEVQLDGVEYDAPNDDLLLNFFASGAELVSATSVPADPAMNIDAIFVDTHLTLIPAKFDFRQETDFPIVTKAKFQIYNQDEVGFSNLEYCIQKCISSVLLSQAEGVPAGFINHFLRENLQTDAGRAVIRGIESELCDLLVDANNDGDVEDILDTNDVAEDAPLLGVAVREYTAINYFGGAELDSDYEVVARMASASTLSGKGMEAGYLKYDVLPANEDRPVVDNAVSNVRVGGASLKALR